MALKPYAVILFSALFLAACDESGTATETSSSMGGGAGDDYAGIDQPKTAQSQVGSDVQLDEGGTASLRVHLTDAPNRDIESAVVTITEVSVHQPGGAPYSVLSEARTLDLLDYQNGVSTLLGEIALESGRYTQLRLAVGEGTVVSEGEEYSVFVPSGTVRLNRPFDVCANGEVDIVVDFDAKKSLRYNPGRDEFRMQPVVTIDSVTQDCPDSETDGEQGNDSGEYEGDLGWISVVMPAVETEFFSSLLTIVDDIRVHTEEGNQVSLLASEYAVDLLEPARQVMDDETGLVQHTVLVPPIEAPVGEMNLFRLLFQPIIVTDSEGRSITLELALDEDGDHDGASFFGNLEICEDALTVLKWDLDLTSSSLDFESDTAVLGIQPAINANVISSCEPLERDGNSDNEGSNGEEDDPENMDSPEHEADG